MGDYDIGLVFPAKRQDPELTAYYRWKALQEDPVSNEQLRMGELEAEVGRLKALVAELALDRRMLQEALKKKP
jgi:hypothetical protein